MRISALLPRIALSVCVLGGMCPARLWGQQIFRRSEGNLQVRVRAGGDVDFTFREYGSRNAPDFPLIVTQTLGCDWQSSKLDLEPTPNAVTGTCRHLLRPRDGVADGPLILSPLVLALHSRGLDGVAMSLTIPGRPAMLVNETAPGWLWTEFRSDRNYYFSARVGRALPPILEIRPVPRPAVTWLAIPFFLTLAIPACAALVLRLRERRSGVSRGVLWTAWIHCGAWMLWLVGVSPDRIVDLVDRLPRHGLLLQLTCATLLFCGPPVLAIAGSLLILRSRLVPDAPSSGRFLRRYCLPDAAVALFFGFVMMGMAVDDQDWRTVLTSIAMGIVSGVTLFWLAIGKAGTISLDSGRLRDRVMELARAAGVSLRSVGVFLNRSRGEANAAAWMPGRRIYVTDSLLEVLTKRETDAALAHEVGHFRAGSLGLPPKLNCTFVTVYLVGHFFLASDSLWGECALVAVAFGLLLLTTHVMRKREFRADQWSAYLTQDPLAMIAALGRLARLHGSPLDWDRAQGAVLSHPSFRGRALAIARGGRIAEAQALAALEDPDSIATAADASSERYDFTVECPSLAMVFSAAKKTQHLGRMTFGYPLSIVLLVFALASVVRSEVAFLCGLPLVWWLANRSMVWLNGRFFNRTALAVSRRLPKPFEGELVTLLPGEDLTPAEGYLAWDFGKLGARGDRLVYCGEKASFSAPREAVVSIDAISKRFLWRRVYGLRIRTDGGAFVVMEATRHNSRRAVAGLERKWVSWWSAEGSTADEVSWAMPPRGLPLRPAQSAPRGGAKALVILVSLQFLAGWLIGEVLPEGRLSEWAVWAGPLLYLATALPAMMAGKGRVAQQEVRARV
jgi:Zn-dependent protease with chaperone function